MNPSAADFIQILEEENRYEALRFILALKENNSMSILEIYENYLTVSLNSMQQTGNEDIDIWREHVRTSIIKTILENLYPYVIKSVWPLTGELWLLSVRLKNTTISGHAWFPTC